jgi:Ca-activated chloride channel family protein
MISRRAIISTFTAAALAIATLAALSSFGIAGASPGSSQHQQSNPIRVEVNLVSILASVLDQNGRPVLDLPQSAFQVLEEGKLQQIARFEPETTQPLDIALMVDTSMSAIAELKLESEAAARFIQQVIRPSDRLAMFEFTDDVTELSIFSNDVPRLQQATRQLKPGAGTSLYDSVVLGSRQLGRQPQDRRRAIVLVTDAGESTSRFRFEDARRAAIASGALIYTVLVRFSPSENLRNTAGEHALDTITDTTGGDLFYVDSSADLDPAFARVDRELRTQYRLRYYPDPRPPAGTLRHVEVRVKGNYSVRYQKSYFAPRSLASNDLPVKRFSGSARPQ